MILDSRNGANIDSRFLQHRRNLLHRVKRGPT